MCHKNTKNI